jgi:agmatine deiminase
VGDWIGHPDGVVRFLDDDWVVINDYSEVDPTYGDELVRILGRHRLQVEVLPYIVDAEPRRGEIGSAVGNRVNFLRVGNLVVMPVYGIPQDDAAIRKMETFLPGTDVVPLPSSELAREGGVGNCVSWTIRGIDPAARNSGGGGPLD